MPENFMFMFIDPPKIFSLKLMLPEINTRASEKNLRYVKKFLFFANFARSSDMNEQTTHT